VVKAKNIYAFDIRGFFPNVYLPHLYATLFNKGYPKWMVDFFQEINNRLPKGLYNLEKASDAMKVIASEPLSKQDLTIAHAYHTK